MLDWFLELIREFSYFFSIFLYLYHFVLISRKLFQSLFSIPSAKFLMFSTISLILKRLFFSLSVPFLWSSVFTSIIKYLFLAIQQSKNTNFLKVFLLFLILLPPRSFFLFVALICVFHAKVQCNLLLLVSVSKGLSLGPVSYPREDSTNHLILASRT